MEQTRGISRRLANELALDAVLRASRDTKLLYGQRFIRLFAYGAAALLLALFLSAQDVSDTRIGLFMTLTLAGDVIISFVLTVFADGLGRRKVLTIGSSMMCMSGVVFALSDNYWILVLASIFGVISPSGNEIGPFRAVEESILAQLTEKEFRSDIFAWYNLIGTFGAALGLLSSGVIVQWLTKRLDWTPLQAYRIVFAAYALLGLIKVVLTLGMSSAVESAPVVLRASPMEARRLVTDGVHDEPANPSPSPLLKRATAGRPILPSTSSRLRALLPAISDESRRTVTQLCAIMSIDAFASGVMTTSWLSYFFTLKFQLAPSVLGTLFLTTGLVSAVSNLFAASLARRIGLIRTMVFTHLPSAVFLLLIPFPRNVNIAVMLLVLRHCTSNMDSAPRQAFISAAVLATERTAIMGVVNVCKTLAQTGAPSLTGWLVQSDRFWLAFVIAGGMKVTYDLSMLWMFSGFKDRDDQEQAARSQA